jgi:glycerol-1-phosphate dehydrogenase [NAD(P)+]
MNSIKIDNKTEQVHFQDITQVRSVADYISSLNHDSLVIYSPTSLEHIDLNNTKVHMIDSRIFGRSVSFIKALAQSKRTYTNIVSLGGGTATDVAKYIAYQSNATFTCIPSMLSTNAFATNKVALVVDGEKITLDAKLADRIILDASLLHTSPQQNLYGLADVLSIHTALKDWELAEKSGVETLDRNIFNQAKNLLGKVQDFVANTDANHLSYEIPELFAYIGESGYITNLHGTGRPESGSEHIFAKALEKRIDIPHGVSVSLGVLLMSLLQDNYSSAIAKTINRIGTLKFIEELGITREVVEEALANIKPREDRYSVINEVSMDSAIARTTVDELIRLTGVKLK